MSREGALRRTCLECLAPLAEGHPWRSQYCTVACETKRRTKVSPEWQGVKGRQLRTYQRLQRRRELRASEVEVD